MKLYNPAGKLPAQTKDIVRRSIALNELTIDAAIQVRASINTEVASEYAASFKAGKQFPPVDVFFDGKVYRLADGAHRVEACKLAGRKSIEAEVHPGSREDCIKWALSANVNHGLRRSNADKRRAVEVALREFPRLSNRALAELCAVSDHFVGSVRNESGAIESHVTATDPSKSEEIRTGRDGKAYSLPPRSAPAPAFTIPAWAKAEHTAEEISGAYEIVSLAVSLTMLKGILVTGQECVDLFYMLLENRELPPETHQREVVMDEELVGALKVGLDSGRLRRDPNTGALVPNIQKLAA